MNMTHYTDPRVTHMDQKVFPEIEYKLQQLLQPYLERTNGT